MTSSHPLILAPQQLDAALDRHRVARRRIVFTNGCFDVLHAGHVRYLEAARHEGDVLFVGVNDDASVARLKGPGRPINPLADRMEVLAALRAIDHVVPFNTDSVEPLIRRVRPDVLVKGGDYTVEGVVGADFVRSYGGRVIVLAHAPGRSSTATIQSLAGAKRATDR